MRARVYTICMRCDAMLCMVVRENEKSVKEKKGNVKADGRADIACECERKRDRHVKYKSQSSKRK